MSENNVQIFESFDLNLLLDSAYGLTNRSAKDNQIENDTVSITMVEKKNGDQSTKNSTVGGSFIWQSNEANATAGLLKVPSSTPMPDAKNIGCGCTQQGCFEKLKTLRLRHRRIMQRKHYKRNRQLQLLQSLTSINPNENSSFNDCEENAGTKLSLPIVLSATQRGFSKIKTRPCWRALYRGTFVLREESHPDDYITTCPCLLHECKTTLKALKEFHDQVIDGKNQELIQGDKMIGQLQMNQ